MDPTPIPARRGRKAGPTCRIDSVALLREMVAHNMTGAELAKAAGITPATVARLLAGGTSTALVIAEALASVLDVEVEQLVTR